MRWGRLKSALDKNQSALDLYGRTLRRQPERVAGFRKVMDGRM